MSSNFHSQLQSFEPMTLTELNATASYLKRIDTKFLMTKSDFKTLLDDLSKDFKVLEIAGNRVFGYDNVYMDTKDYFFYNQHQEKYNSRTKVRTRLYTDSNLAFFEYKQKVDGITRKYRYQFPIKEHGEMTKGKQRFFDGVWQSIYDETKTPEIFPSIKTKYSRITLVSKQGEERLTIDFDVKTKNLRNKRTKETELKNVVIVESKTLSKNCKSLNILKKHGHFPAKSCSKYSLGVIYAGLVEKFDTFKETMERIKEIRLDTMKNRFRTTDLRSFKTKEINLFRKEKIENVLQK